MPDQITMNELIHLVKEQAQKIVMLEEKLGKLELELEKYKVRKDSNNSSVPPSKDENRPPRTSSLRQKSDRKVGGQPGHEGKTLEMTQTPDQIIEHRACFCPECGKDLNNRSFELFGKRQIIDIPTIKQVVTEHQVYRCSVRVGELWKVRFLPG